VLGGAVLDFYEDPPVLVLKINWSGSGYGFLLFKKTTKILVPGLVLFFKRQSPNCGSSSKNQTYFQSGFS